MSYDSDEDDFDENFRGKNDQKKENAKIANEFMPARKIKEFQPDIKDVEGLLARYEFNPFQELIELYPLTVLSGDYSVAANTAKFLAKCIRPEPKAEAKSAGAVNVQIINMQSEKPEAAPEAKALTENGEVITIPVNIVEFKTIDANNNTTL